MFAESLHASNGPPFFRRTDCGILYSKQMDNDESVWEFMDGYGSNLWMTLFALRLYARVCCLTLAALC